MKNGEVIFERRSLILCEGDDDRRFFWQLITKHNIAGQYDVRFPGDRSGGRGKFGPWLANTRVISPTFRQNVKAVLIVSDNDDNHETSLNQVRTGLRNAGGFGVPPDERVVARSPGYPDIVILMLPMGEPGNLETLCLKAAYEKWAIKGALDAYVAATPATAWDISDQSKMRMHATLAATCATKPETTFGYHWQEPEAFHVPIDNPCFDTLVEFLRGFDALLAR